MKKKERVKKNYREVTMNDWHRIGPEINDRNKFAKEKLYNKKNGKGDLRRRKSVDYETWSNNYDAIFGKKEDQE